MENFFTDNEDIVFHLENMDLSEVIKLIEDDFKDNDKYLDAPGNTGEAIDNYKKVLNLIGEIAGEYIAPDSMKIDEEGAVFCDGAVELPASSLAAIRRLSDAGLMGFTLPREYDGLNLPKTIYSMAIEIISRADASLMTIFGLQEISGTIDKYGTEEQKERYLREFSSGKVLGAMALTEPDAGSDLGAARLKAVLADNGKWYLNGVKRFITNGCAEILLVMARSEMDIEDARGLSLFIYRRDKNMQVRRIENKLGIHGSPTCELQFNNAEAELLGQRKRGLIKYTMSLMNGARLGVSAQALGIAEAAYREASAYATKRLQFNVAINTFPPVYEMLTDMKVNIEGGRSLLYETSRIVDLKEGIEKKIALYPEKKGELRKILRTYSDYELLFTPMLKCYATEIANQICYDALQVHGGVGYTHGFKVEQLCRDVRITSIYEGTTQLQVVAAIGGLLKGIATNKLNEYESNYKFGNNNLINQARKFKTLLKEAVTHIQSIEDQAYQQFHSRRLVDMAADTVISYLLLIDALHNKRKTDVAALFIAKANYRIKSRYDYIISNDKSHIILHDNILN